MHLVIVDTAQIQPYIFGSNRLRENIGASHLVAAATNDWAKKVVHTVAPRHNIDGNGNLDRTKHIEDLAPDFGAEVLYAGGGNFVVLFRHEDIARAFTRKLSRKALTEAPNLHLVIAQQALHWKDAPHQDHSLYETVQAVFKRLAEQKAARAPSAPLLGLGVTVMCESTGLPATGMVPPIRDDPTSAYAASAEIFPKREAVSGANERLKRLFQDVLGEDYDFPYELDDLGRTVGEHSFIAIVHADGNGVGQRIMKIGTQHAMADQNRLYIEALRDFSNALEKAAQGALHDTLRPMTAKIVEDKDKRIIIHKHEKAGELVRLELRHEQGHWYLPFRPIVFGGDDVTFVCDGRIGLALATEYLRAFEKHTTNLLGQHAGVTACAGVGIVKAHYPFARAYHLAHELCQSAKTYRRHKAIDGSCLDWYFALSGLAGDLDDIRRQEYEVIDRLTGARRRLTLRPVALASGDKQSPRSWAVVQEGVVAFQGDDWVGRRNKAKALRDALREGPEAVQWFLTRFGLKNGLPEINDYPDFAQYGWWGKYCGYFDALELADWYIPV